IIFPQTVRIALPAVMNDFISLVKSTSLASSITIIEMTMVGQQFASVTYEPLILYMEVAVIYLLISTVLTWIQGKLEIKTSKYLKKA
ncbi:MAG: cysteine ABC transporter permease, partial [Trichococcus flocculiformis]